MTHSKFITGDNKYWLLTKREVKMAGYWPSSFFACLWTETKIVLNFTSKHKFYSN